MKLIDTNIAIYVLHLHQRACELIQRLESLPYLSTISIMELFHGAENKQDEEDIEEMIRDTRIIPVSTIIARRAGKILNELHKNGKKNASKEDILIAATALTLEVPFVTANWRDFQKIPGLIVEKFIP